MTGSKIELTKEEKDLLIRWLEEKSDITSYHMRRICQQILAKLKG